MGEYELAAQRLEILAKIHALDGNQKKRENLQQQLGFFETEQVHMLLQLPAIRDADRSVAALAELEHQLRALKLDSPFFKTLDKKLEIKNADAIVANVLKDHAFFASRVQIQAEKKFNAETPGLQHYLEYVAFCEQHLSTAVNLVVQQAKAHNEDHDEFRKIVANFENACATQKEALKQSIPKNPMSSIEGTPLDPASPEPLIDLYSGVVSSKKMEISRNEALAYFAEDCKKEKQKIEEALGHCDEKQRELEQLQAELKTFDEAYFNHPNITNLMPHDALWKLGVDARDHQHGRLVYDQGLHRCGKFSDYTEPGYTDGMETALAFIVRNAGNELTPELIAQVRHIACYFQYLSRSGIKPKVDDYSYRQDSGNLPIKPDYFSEKGIREVADWGIWAEPMLGLLKSSISLTLEEESIKNFLDLLHTKGTLHVGRDQPRLYMGEYIQQYHQWMIDAGDDDDKKLLAIAKFCRLIDCSHPFADGNIRTVRLLMLKLMLENKLVPTMMMDPNMLDSYHSSEVVKAMKEGQHTYELEYLLARIDEPGIKDQLKAKIIDQCEERHGLFIANNVKKLRDLFPEHVELINARSQCVIAKGDDFYSCYCDNAVQSRYDANVQAIFAKHSAIAASNRALTTSPQTLFGGPRTQAATPDEPAAEVEQDTHKKPDVAS